MVVYGKDDIWFGPVFRGSLTPAGMTYTDPGGQPYTVFKTNLSGVGIVIRKGSYTTLVGWFSANWGVGQAWGYDNAQWAHPKSDWNGQGIGAQFGFAFVKTGNITGGSINIPGTVAEFTPAGPEAGGSTPLGGVSTTSVRLSGGPTFNVLACLTPSVTVPMGTHFTSALPTVNSTTNAVSFQIALNNCPAGLGQFGSAIQYRIDPSTTVLSVPQSVVALDSSSTARGVGVQLLDDASTPLPFSTNQKMNGYTGAGNYSIPLKARYFRTGTLSPGTANTVMTFTMTYM
jgi:major type 1 subunit fimbrin (pilin)